MRRGGEERRKETRGEEGGDRRQKKRGWEGIGVEGRRE